MSKFRCNSLDAINTLGFPILFNVYVFQLIGKPNLLLLMSIKNIINNK